jgi:hypothetical protein
MRTALACLCLAGLLAGGCNKAGLPAGSASTPAATANLGPRGSIDWGEDGISSPTVQKGKSATFHVTIKREGFKGDVQLEFAADAASGIKIDPVTIPAEKNSVEVTVTASPTAIGGLIYIQGKRPGFDPYPGPQVMVNVQR